ncbi:MAG: N-acetyltransferase family protein [Xenococcaceae cyanobacterium]
MEQNISNNFKLRPAVEADLPQINEIYNYYVSNSTCVWTTHICTEQERKEWFASHDDATPVLVAEQNGKVIAWGTFSLFKTACTFHKTVENSVYVHHEFQRQGIGSKLLAELVRRAREAGFESVIAAISSDREASLALHRAAGFQEVGRFHQVGYKFERYMDVVYLQLRLVNR